ncbi:hypothetical protein DXG01_009631 [Tephrocybe rancida]|nr:hypothetical protein DXG01_009631 [Tephrocybe rancida]
MTVIKLEKYLNANKKKSKSKSKPTRMSRDLLWKHLLPSNVEDDNDDNGEASRGEHDNQPPAKRAKTNPEWHTAAHDLDIEELPAPHQPITHQPACMPLLHHTLDLTPSPPRDTRWCADPAPRPRDLSPNPQFDPSAMMQKMFEQQQEQMAQQFALMATLYGFAPKDPRESSCGHMPANAVAGSSCRQHSHDDYSDDEHYDNSRYRHHGHV